MIPLQSLPIQKNLFASAGEAVSQPIGLASDRREPVRIDSFQVAPLERRARMMGETFLVAVEEVP